MRPPRDQTARGRAWTDGGRRANPFDGWPDPAIGYRVDQEGPIVVAANAAYEDQFGTVRAGQPLVEALPALVSGESGRKLAARIAAGDPLDATVSVVRPGDADRNRASVPNEAPNDGGHPGRSGDEGGHGAGARTYRVRSGPVGAQPTEGPGSSTTGADGYVLFTPIPGPAGGRTDRGDRLDLFASVVSHDLRNPLDVARIRLDAAEESGDPVHFEKVREAHDRIRRLSRDVLFLAEADRSIDPTPVDPDAVARAAWEPIAVEAATLEVASMPSIRADRGLLRRLFENLFENAVEHAGEAVTVRVTPITTAGEGAGFAVVDDGPGIPPAARDRVFEPRETLDGGTGLGLAVVARVVEAHGWQVRVTDASDGGGARFEVTGLDPAGDDRREGEAGRGH